MIREILVTNFRSFGSGTHRLSLGTEPGVYFLTGENREEPALGSNGSGKSSVWEALCWGVYGKTSRNLKAGDVNTWGSDPKSQTQVTVVTARGRISRTWRPNTLHIDGEDATQEQVEQLVGLTHHQFLHAVFVAQFAPMFLDLPHQMQTDLFGEILQLEGWEKLSAAAKTKAAAIESDLTSANVEARVLQRQIEELEATSFEKEIERWEDERQDELVALRRKRRDVVTRLSTMRPVKTDVKELREELREVVGEEREQTTYRYDAIQSKGAIEKKATKVAAALELAEQQYALITKSDICPMCRQPIFERHVKDERARLESLIKAYEDEIISLAQQVEGFQNTIDAAESRLEEIREVKDSLGKKIAVLNDRKESADRARSEQESLLATYEKSIAAVESEKNPHRILAVSAKRKLQSARLKLRDEEDRAAALTTRLQRVGYWKKGFMDVRLFLISEALQQLEIEVNSALLELGLDGWRVEFDVDRMTKGGSVRKGFAVTVHSPHNSEPVPWEAWSGGESQRLRIAATMGLSSLINSALGTESDLEVWDEPSTWLSEQGIEDLLESLHSRAMALGKRVWVVDHRTLAFGGFRGSATVVKEPEKGSRIVQ